MIYILLGLAAVGFFLLIYFNRRVKNKLKVVDYEQYDTKTFDYEVLGLINQYRKENGLGELGMNYVVNNIANSHVIWLTENVNNNFDEVKHYYQQERSEQIQLRLGKNTQVAENIAGNYTSAFNYVEGWKRSARHREIMLGGFNEIGIASNDDYCETIYIKTN